MSSVRETLVHEIESLPRTDIEAVLRFIRILKQRHSQADLGLPLLSEAVLARDWLRPEEDEAWSEL